MPQISRGIRNKNPGNIDRTGTKWLGMAEDQSSDPRFIVFKSAQYGIRAMAKVLLTYQNTHGLNTVRQIINRWAPPVENATNAYVASVAEFVGVDPDAEIDVDSVEIMLPLIKAIIKKENQLPGVPWVQPYSDKVIMEAMRMAGVHDAPPKSIVKRIVTLSGAGAAAVGGAVSDPDNLTRAQGLLKPLVAVSPVLQGVFVAITLGLLGLTMLGISKANKHTGGA